MTSRRLYLVRHGEAAAGWGDDLDPGLSDAGRAQAEAMAATLEPLGPLPILVSPLRRTRETASALERAWGTTAVVEPIVSEIPSPTDDLDERRAWLTALLPVPMRDWPDDLQAWRGRLRGRLLAIDVDTVVVTHFVAIKSTLDREDVHPDYCSITVIENDGRTLTAVELGAQRPTVIR